MRINQNIAAFNAYRNLNQTQSGLASSLEKLSSGFRINRAADDASGLVNSENLRSQIGGLKVATRNAQDSISMVQTAEGAQTEVHSILQRMRDLAVQSGNLGTNDDAALQANQSELNELVAELDRIADQTQFGTLQILNGDLAGSDAVDAIVDAAVTRGDFTPAAGGAGDPSTAVWEASDLAAPEGYEGNLTFTVGGGGLTSTEVEVAADASLADIAAAFDAVTGLTATVDGDNIDFATTGNSDADLTLSVANVNQDAQEAQAGATFQVGANAGQTIEVNISGVSASDLSVTGLVIGGDGVDATTIDAAINAIDDAISSVSTNRAELGAFQNRAESTIRNLAVAVENLSAAESRIRDTDMALEMVEFTRNQILQQAGTSMLAQANLVPQSVLSLL